MQCTFSNALHSMRELMYVTDDILLVYIALALVGISGCLLADTHMFCSMLCCRR
jgi:hypothetical protein